VGLGVGKILVDTNVLMNNPDILDNGNYVISGFVIRELEKLKQSENNERSYKARLAVRKIEENADKLEFVLQEPKNEFDDYDDDYIDNRILTLCKQQGFSLLTGDLLLKMKARAVEVNVVEVEEKQYCEEYTGIHKLYLTSSLEDQEMLAHIYSQPESNDFDLLTNQYLIIYDKEKPIYNDFGEIVNYQVIDKFRYNGEKLVPLKLPNKKIVNPKNEEQACALDLLYNPDIPIKIIAGTYGSGKTYLTVKMALYHVLEKGTHSKIMVIRNPIGSGEAIGWLKGTKEDKTQDFFKPIIQHLDGGEQEAFYLEQRGQLIKEIPYYIKGLSIEDTFVIVDEAEDLDVKLLKLIGTRLGENSCIVFSGDFKQAESKYIHNNGLLRAIDKLKGHPLVGIVVLQEDVRSEASKVFTEFD
jgi:PhoH-like ATPase